MSGKESAVSWSVRLLVAAAVVACGALLGWGLVAGREKAAVEEQQEGAIKVPVRVSDKNGERVIRLDAETQQRSGIETRVLSSAPHPEQLRAYGMVLDVARLTELSNSYANAKAQVQTAQAKLAMSKPAYDRAQKLFNETHVVSQAQVQAAEAAFGTDQASLVAAEAQVRTLSATAYQEWGAVLGKSLIEESPMIKALIERQSFLLQITLPPGVVLPAPPATASIKVGDTRQQIAFVSPATRIDPRIQGVSFFYTVAAASGVLPGMNVLAFLPTGKSIEGVAVPPSAVVWWQGRAWIYRRTDPSSFTRLAIATDAPAPDGGYIANNVAKDAEIVTQGAQLLLSEEFRAQIQVGEDSQ
ncbi:efflux RND transporter periplasmic adaptor subunit [Bradyrhizobium sp. ISRA443]|uniref:efflux RND transporter periplasmic adaptor subunit n=1 Tax=unclassified Bradyrhizobium TaxID=2631580 RepID=UPI0024788B3A|nr:MULTISPECIES: efflux RND transporter periplasmic adaptor subunit [unclassified Bradyrhizobium]WGR91433.1 efflux RND transporter periplasmic adaptor subunit [Bradyrhizobium sp. ISRA435]WGS01688.1 efflux RND transporter periplasmic adaptor subunit [Bradyrhizobium sp. ISRA436]WGS08574.1 efflux RND transporter periplasmic adaptor subunit [Bradyrhizobium sp. ISRA437]WGS15462.1 efflux RND transporter periplasmic adaptor subunit [Bradyrhizobium sp. ISRA443]